MYMDKCDTHKVKRDDDMTKQHTRVVTKAVVAAVLHTIIKATIDFGHDDDGVLLRKAVGDVQTALESFLISPKDLLRLVAKVHVEALNMEFAGED